MLVDQVKIFVKAGDGGKGCVAFRREKYVPKGGPSGGNGGKGGNVIIKAVKNLYTLLDLRYQQHYSAPNGGNGLGSDMHGHAGKNIEIKIPVGTTVKNVEDSAILADLTEEGQQYTAARGGRGGKGNAHFKSSRIRAPKFAQPGEPGDECWLNLELKMLADVSIVGCPNAGKSTLISRVSNAKPKIADYPFTTLVPNLGVVPVEEFESFVIADIPGIIEGAHNNKGLGLQFLKHIERSKLLLHILDLAAPDDRNIYQDYETINNEINSFNPDLSEKPQIIAAN
ncbi:MAG: GTPase ObgE, partial [Nitrospinota bacterium]|nr:GTPase ObgE [Nitrospinota bacterium]